MSAADRSLYDPREGLSTRPLRASNAGSSRSARPLAALQGRGAPGTPATVALRLPARRPRGAPSARRAPSASPFQTSAAPASRAPRSPAPTKRCLARGARPRQRPRRARRRARRRAPKAAGTRATSELPARDVVLFPAPSPRCGRHRPVLLPSWTGRRPRPRVGPPLPPAAGARRPRAHRDPRRPARARRAPRRPPRPEGSASRRAPRPASSSASRAACLGRRRPRRGRVRLRRRPARPDGPLARLPFPSTPPPRPPDREAPPLDRVARAGLAWSATSPRLRRARRDAADFRPVASPRLREPGAPSAR